MPGAGATVNVGIQGGGTFRAVVRDISRGGVSLKCDGTASPGTRVLVDLPAGGAVPGRVARTEDGVLSVAFRQAAATLKRLDQAFHALQRDVRDEAA